MKFIYALERIKNGGIIYRIQGNAIYLLSFRDDVLCFSMQWHDFKGHLNVSLETISSDLSWKTAVLSTEDVKCIRWEVLYCIDGMSFAEMINALKAFPHNCYAYRKEWGVVEKKRRVFFRYPDDLVIDDGNERFCSLSLNVADALAYDWYIRKSE